MEPHNFLVRQVLYCDADLQRNKQRPHAIWTLSKVINILKRRCGSGGKHQLAHCGQVTTSHAMFHLNLLWLPCKPSSGQNLNMRRGALDNSPEEQTWRPGISAGSYLATKNSHSRPSTPFCTVVS